MQPYIYIYIYIYILFIYQNILMYIMNKKLIYPSINVLPRNVSKSEGHWDHRKNIGSLKIQF